LNSNLELNYELEELKDAKQNLEEQLKKIENLFLKEADQENKKKLSWKIAILQQLKEKVEVAEGE